VARCDGGSRDGRDVSRSRSRPPMRRGFDDFGDVDCNDFSVGGGSFRDRDMFSGFGGGLSMSCMNDCPT